ncbi:MAG: glycoside hydrolase family 3 N-terminal domain-containing protein [Gemmatimonadaceae bacterium]
MSDLAQLLVPALRWDPEHGFANARETIDPALAAGVGGFIIFGGNVGAVAELTTYLHQNARFPLLVMSDLERGAGQQFQGATGLPPLGALGAADDEGLTRAAARLTAREGAALGIRMILAPVADVDLNPANPIVGTRAFGTSAAHVARHVRDWIDECQREGAMACAKHFPGHGRTATDSHSELPVVDATEAELIAHDLLPFREAIEAGVAAIMTAHVAYPALDYLRSPATLSRRILRTLLRNRMGFEGLVLTDAMIMSGVLGDGDEGKAGVRALDAGCDVLLYPENVDGVQRALEEGVRGRTLSLRELDRSLERRHRAAAWSAAQAKAGAITDRERDAVRALCDSAVQVARGDVPEIRGVLDVIIVDDDVGGPYPPPSRAPLHAALGEAGFDVQVVHEATPRVERADADETGPDAPPALPTLRDRLRPSSTVVVFAFNDIRAWKGTPGFSDGARTAIQHVVLESREMGREAIVVLLAHPRLAADLGEARLVVSAWGGERPMQLAVARWLAGRR